MKNNLLLSNSGVASIWQAAPAKLQVSNNQQDEILRSALAKLEDWATPAPNEMNAEQSRNFKKPSPEYLLPLSIPKLYYN